MKKRIVLATALLAICLSACAKESTITKEVDVAEESTEVDPSDDENVIEKEQEEASEDTEKVSVEISDEDWENLLSYGNIFAEYTFGDNMDMLFRYYIYHWKEVPVDPILQVEADPLNRLAPYVGSGSVVRIPAEAIRWIGNHIFKLDNVDYAEERYPEEANIGGAFYQTDGYYYYCEVDYAGWEDCIASSVLNYSVLDDGKIYVQIEEVTPSDRYSLYLLCEIQNSGDKRYWVFDEISKEPILSDDVFTDRNTSKDTASDEQAKSEIPEAYKKIIEDYIEKFPWNENSFQDASWVYMYYTDLGGIGYALVDIDNNGVEELLIGDTKLGSQDKFNSQIIDGYTIVGDKAVHILTSGERWTYHLCKNGELVEFGSSSAFTTSWDKYVMDKDGTKLSFVESLVLDGYYAEQIGLVDSAENADENNSWFYTDTQGANYEGYVHISAEIAAEKKQVYEDSFLNIEYIPLSLYSVKAK